MAQLVVRNLDNYVKAKLQKRAQRHGRSTEEEVREILRTTVRLEDARRAVAGAIWSARIRKRWPPAMSATSTQRASAANERSRLGTALCTLSFSCGPLSTP